MFEGNPVRLQQQPTYSCIEPQRSYHTATYNGGEFLDISD